VPCAGTGQGFTKGGGVNSVGNRELNRLHHACIVDDSTPPPLKTYFL
jgi:hypothetical protein